MHVLSDLHRKGVSFRHWPCVTLYTSELPGHSRIAVKYLCLCTVLCLVSRGPLAIRRVMARLSLAFDHHSSCVGRGGRGGFEKQSAHVHLNSRDSCRGDSSHTTANDAMGPWLRVRSELPTPSLARSSTPIFSRWCSCLPLRMQCVDGAPQQYFI